MVNFAPKTFRSVRCCTALKRWRCRRVKLRTPTVYVSAGKTNLLNASNVCRVEPAREQNIDLCFAKAARPCCVYPTMHLHRQSALAPPADRCNEMLRVDFFNLLCSPHITWPCTRRWFLMAYSARPCLKALFNNALPHVSVTTSTSNSFPNQHRRQRSRASSRKSEPRKKRSLNTAPRDLFLLSTSCAPCLTQGAPCIPLALLVIWWSQVCWFPFHCLLLIS